MPSASQICRSDPRFVGDPIDVVTGANTDAPVDLTQRGPILFQWVRYYDSARSHIHGSLGWGHSHDFDRTLTRDLDGLRYEDPTGKVVGFIDIDVGSRFVASGLTLIRVNEQTYLMATPGQPDEEYRFTPASPIARLARLIRGKDTIELRYANGLLSEIVDSRGRLIRVTSDKGNRVLKMEVVDPKNNLPLLALLTYEYDPAGNLIRATDYFRNTLSFVYDTANRMTRRTDRVGYAFHFRYDDEGRCVHSRGDDGLFEVSLDYQPDAKTTFVRRGDGGQWIYFYNDAGTITQITDPYGNATLFVQDEAGRTVQEVDPNGNVTQLHYNWLDQHDYRIDPNGHVLPTRAQDPDPPDPLAYQLPETPMEWEFGNLLSRETITPPKNDDPILCLFPASVYNAVLGMTNVNQKTAVPSANGQPISEQVDEFDRPLEQTGPNFTERWQYDAYGNLIEHRDREGAVSRRVFGSWNSLKQEIDPLGHVTTFDHTTQGSVAKVVDPGGTVTEYGYDLCERLIEVRRQGKVRETYRRDRAGNIIGKKDSQGKSLVTWEIGPGNVDTVRILASGERHEFAHDERGRITGAKAPSGAVTMTYDEDGKMLSDQRDGKGVIHDFEWATLLSTTYFDKFKVVYETDDNGDLLITDPLGGQHRFKRSATGLIAKLFASGDRELCHFDKEGRCLNKAVVRASSGMRPRMRSYQYSQTGDLLTVNDTESGYTKYAYDEAHRLGKETIPGGETRYFGFDAAGNLMFQPGLADVAYDPGNRITRANGDLFAHNLRDHISVRMNGRSKTHYHYNDLDMLVRCDIDGTEWTASYDSLCRRVQKTWVGRTTTYYWDDFRLAAEVRNDDSVRIYIYADEVALVPFLFVEYADLEAEPSDGKLYYIFTNQVGVPIRVEDAAGKACWTARIDPFGAAHIGKGCTLEMPLRFPGHYFDPETGLHYNRFRYYSPELGSYWQSDPAGQDAAINLYAYPVSPLIGVDIDGLKKPSASKGPKAASPPAKVPNCPAGGMSIPRRRAQGGEPPPHITAANQHQYYYDKKSGQYKLRPEPKPDMSQKGKDARAIPCFPRGTLVATPRGKIAIESLAVGDSVCTFDEFTSTSSYMPISAVLRNRAVHLVKIVTDAGTIHATPRHRFWVENFLRWISAAQLKPGMILRTLDGNLVFIRETEYAQVAEGETFNLTVVNHHTFFVGDGGFLVHNEGDEPNGKVYVGHEEGDPDKTPIYVGKTKQPITKREGQHHDEAEEKPQMAYKKNMVIEPAPGMTGLTDDQMAYHERRVYDEKQEELKKAGKPPLKNDILPLTDKKINELKAKQDDPKCKP